MTYRKHNLTVRDDAIVDRRNGARRPDSPRNFRAAGRGTTIGRRPGASDADQPAGGVAAFARAERGGAGLRSGPRHPPPLSYRTRRGGGHLPKAPPVFGG